MALQVMILKGLPGSGKSTWAKQYMAEHPGQFKRVNKDSLRNMLDDGKWYGGNEKMVIHLRNEIIIESLKSGKSVIVDDTNLHPKHEYYIRELVKNYFPGENITIEIVDFTSAPLEECIKRDLKRENSVGERVIKRMYRDFLAPSIPVVERNPNLPNAIICDLDGTIALLNGRNPYDASTCVNDLPNIPIIDLVELHLLDGVECIFVSGRENKYRNETETWLKRYFAEHIGYRTEFHMRKTGDARKDSIVKQEMYDEHIKGQYNVLFVLDDRDSVVEMWRQNGLICLQVAEGDF